MHPVLHIISLSICLLYIVNVTTVLPIHYCIKQKFLLKIIKLYSIVYKVNGQDLLPIVSIFPLVPAFNIKSPTINKHTRVTQISQNTTRFVFFNSSSEENRVLALTVWVRAFIDNEFPLIQFLGGGEVRGVVTIQVLRVPL